MTTEKTQLLERFKDWILFVQMLQKKQDEIWNTKIADDKWSIREIVSHIMLWDKYFLDEAIVKIVTHNKLSVQHLNFDEFNNNAKAYGISANINEIAEKAIFYRNQIICQILSLTEEEYSKSYLDGDNNPFSVVQYLNDFLSHDEQNMNQIKALI